MAFTSWFYVRPSGFHWLNDQGENVSVVGGEGPDEAHFQRHEEASGIRLVMHAAQPQR